MKEYNVPCSTPFNPISIAPDDETVVLKVGMGSDKAEFIVPIVALCRSSDYFESRLLSRTDNLVPESLLFLRESPAYFSVYLDFIQFGELRHSNLRPKADSIAYFRFLIELFAFAGRYKINRMHDALLAAFYLRIFTTHDIPYACIPYVYQQTGPNSSLRDMIVDIVVNVGDRWDMKHYQHQMQRLFLVDCMMLASQDSIARFTKSGDEISAWLEEKRDKICEQYHVHDIRKFDHMRTNEEGVEVDGDDAQLDDSSEEEVLKRELAKLEAIAEQIRSELAVIEDMKKLRLES
ncbi:hypothetical protein EK21DRAFT_109369 [Setomelanomma holmii]|uniref:BTB domain-containing protein n=1 Tax=Setomelanomma holmii TaxID=210430 RepID=A0A9P4HGM3_9PLEO|nr:hypothetical protein EK21DRAFT_109369 [Setomelanomma holmii]